MVKMDYLTIASLFIIAIDVVMTHEEQSCHGLEGKLQSVLDTLQSIENKLLSLEVKGQERTGNYNMDAFQIKLSNIEEKLEKQLQKSQQPTLEDLSQKMDSIAEKLFARVGIFEAKSSVQMASVGVKIQRMKRNLGRSVDDTLDKILKIEEKNAQIIENLWTMQVKEGQKYPDANKERAYGDGSDFREQKDGHEDDTEQKHTDGQLTNQAEDLKTTIDTSSLSDNPCPVEFWHNVSDLLTNALLMGEKKVAELDGDIEIYTRKVLNAYQELFKESKGMEDNVNKVLEQENHSQELLKDGFRRLFQQMKPIGIFRDILQSLHKKISEMDATFDTSFASLLVAQNTFISLLQRMVTKMDEKTPSAMVPLHASSDILWTAFESHRKDVGRALRDLVWTVIKVGNDTVEEVGRTLGQFQEKRDICQCN